MDKESLLKVLNSVYSTKGSWTLTFVTKKGKGYILFKDGKPVSSFFYDPITSKEYLGDNSVEHIRELLRKNLITRVSVIPRSEEDVIYSLIEEGEKLQKYSSCESIENLLFGETGEPYKSVKEKSYNEVRTKLVKFDDLIRPENVKALIVNGQTLLGNGEYFKDLYSVVDSSELDPERAIISFSNGNAVYKNLNGLRFMLILDREGFQAYELLEEEIEKRIKEFATTNN